MFICSRYGSAAEFNLLEKTYRVKWPDGLVLPQGMIYPHKPAPVVVQMKEELVVRLMSFSLVPSWSKVRKPKFTTYNARIEEVLSKPTWREPFKRNHCLVPIKYFVESVYDGPYAGHNISIEDSKHDLMTAAGIWDTWFDHETGEVIDSFAILTCEPPKEIFDAGHDRCPLFLKPSAWSQWLQSPGQVQFLLDSREAIHFEFNQREPLKSFSKQLSFDGE